MTSTKEDAFTSWLNLSFDTQQSHHHQQHHHGHSKCTKIPLFTSSFNGTGTNNNKNDTDNNIHVFCQGFHGQYINVPLIQDIYSKTYPKIFENKNLASIDSLSISIYNVIHSLKTPPDLSSSFVLIENKSYIRYLNSYICSHMVSISSSSCQSSSTFKLCKSTCSELLSSSFASSTNFSSINDVPNHKFWSVCQSENTSSPSSSYCIEATLEDQLSCGFGLQYKQPLQNFCSDQPQLPCCLLYRLMYTQSDNTSSNIDKLRPYNHSSTNPNRNNSNNNSVLFYEANLNQLQAILFGIVFGVIISAVVVIIVIGLRQKGNYEDDSQVYTNQRNIMSNLTWATRRRRTRRGGMFSSSSSSFDSQYSEDDISSLGRDTLVDDASFCFPRVSSIVSVGNDHLNDDMNTIQRPTRAHVIQ